MITTHVVDETHKEVDCRAKDAVDVFVVSATFGLLPSPHAGGKHLDCYLG